MVKLGPIKIRRRRGREINRGMGCIKKIFLDDSPMKRFAGDIVDVMLLERYVDHRIMPRGQGKINGQIICRCPTRPTCQTHGNYVCTFGCPAAFSVE